MKFLRIKADKMAVNAQTGLLHTEPLTHFQNTRSCRQRCLCLDYSLTREQLHRFYPLKTEANILFDQDNRWDLVEALYTQYFQQPPQRSGKEWLRLGFQGKYPQTDFRGGGVLSLQLILRFVKHNRALVQLMEQDKAGFFFAITAINIAFFMKKYFHLADFLVPGKDEEVYCSRRALKNFLRLLGQNSQAYEEIHEHLLKYFYNNMWTVASRENTQTLLKFNELFDRLTARLRSVFDGQELHTLRQFKDAFGL